MNEPRVWQIACGEAGRRYSRLFLDHDLMFLGPGRFGPYDPKNYEHNLAAERFSRQIIGEIRRIATEIEPGDFVLLRSGYHVLALGQVAEEDYHHNPALDDVYGWDLQHSRRVIWQEHLRCDLEAMQNGHGMFAARKQIPTLTRVHDNSILHKVRPLLTRCKSRTLNALPTAPPAALSMDELGQELFAKGLAYDAVHRVRETILKQRRLLEWYGRSLSGNRPSEHEIVAHIILPLMHALGWSEQLLAVEWNRIDLAVFWGTPTDRQHCKMICEAKTMGTGLERVVHQAEGYCKQWGLTECDKIVVADGGRFYLYHKDDSDWPVTPTGYFNVNLIRRAHLCPPGTDAVETLMALTPTYVAR